MVIKVCKFGGTSLATREQIEKSIDIMLADNDRKFMIVSAPGARHSGDVKITDLLIAAAKGDGLVVDPIKHRIYETIPDFPALADSLVENLDSRLAGYFSGDKMEVLKAYGEFASANIINAILRKKKIISEFLDPRRLNFIIDNSNNNPRPDPACYKDIARVINVGFDKTQIVVIPGFYGYTKSGFLTTLPRNGTDITGAVIARAVREMNINYDIVYENFSDEDGLKRANPKIVSNAEVIPEMTYLEARELAYMGFKLQDGCFSPIVGQRIILNARNTNNPLHPGTKIMDLRDVDSQERIVGVACENDSILFGFKKMYSDQEVGLGRKMFAVLEELGIPYEHSPTGVDTFSLVIRGRYLNSGVDSIKLAEKISQECKVESFGITNMSLLSIVGLGMQNHYDVHRRIFSALEKTQTHVRMSDEGAEDLSFFVGVDREKAEDSVRAIYSEFFDRKELDY